MNFVSFSIEGDEVVGLIGPNRSGISTALNVITETLLASSGQVIFGGVNVAWWFVGLIERVIRLGNRIPVPAFSADIVAELKGAGEMT